MQLQNTKAKNCKHLVHFVLHSLTAAICKVNLRTKMKSPTCDYQKTKTGKGHFKGPFTLAIFAICCDFQCDFLLVTDVKEWISIMNVQSIIMFLHLHIRVWFTRSHASKGENRTRNRSKSCKCKRP